MRPLDKEDKDIHFAFKMLQVIIIGVMIWALLLRLAAYWEAQIPISDEIPTSSHRIR